MALNFFELSKLRTPQLLIRLDRVRHNLQKMKTYFKGDLSRWQPHIKTTKIPEIWSMLINFGVRRFKCATVREAKILL